MEFLGGALLVLFVGFVAYKAYTISRKPDGSGSGGSPRPGTKPK